MASNGPPRPLIPPRYRSGMQTLDPGAELESPTVSAHRERPELRREWRLFVTLLVMLDASTVLFSLWLAHTLRISSGLLEYYGPRDEAAYQSLAFVSLPLWLLLFAAAGLYRREHLLGGTFEYQQVLKVCTAGVIGMVLVSFLFRDQFLLVSRGWLLMAWTLCTLLVLIERFAARRIGYAARRRGKLTSRVLLVGANAQGLAMAQQWIASPTSGLRVVGFLDDFKTIGAHVSDGLRVLGRPRNLHDIANQLEIDEVVVVPNAIAWETFEEIILNGNCDGDYFMRLSPGFYELMSTSVAVTNHNFVPLLTVHENRLVGVDAVVKATLDLGLGLPLFLVSLPVLGVLVLLHKRQNPDLPWLEKTLAYRPQGQPFEMMRLRTHRSDGTLTDLGVWLERTELDRMPQLWHVVRGQMSLVGPQPQTASEGEDSVRAMRSQRTLKPGVIGPWSVWTYWSPEAESGYDLYYVRNWTPWLDLQIVFQTMAMTVRKLLRWANKT